MKSIVFNFYHSTLNKITEAVTLKVGYLLGKEICTAGSSSFDLLMVEMQSNYPIPQIFKSLENRFKNDPEQLDQILQMKFAYKQTSKVKYKQPQFLAAYKKAEKSLRHYWLTVLEEMSEFIDSLGFHQIKQMDAMCVRHYFVAEEAEFSFPGAVTASNLLQRYLPDAEEDAQPEIFLLGDEFLNDDYEKPPIYSIHNDEAFDTNNIYLHKCFTFPNINPLSAAELEAIRKQLQNDDNLFNANMDEWIDMCYFDDNVQERIEFLKNQVLPSAQKVQQNIADNNTLKLCSRLQSNEIQIEVWIGEMPVWQLWNYYKDYKVIGSDTWQKLEQLKEDEAYKGKRWPVMMLAPLKSEINYPIDDEPEEIKASKKYILID